MLADPVAWTRVMRSWFGDKGLVRSDWLGPMMTNGELLILITYLRRRVSRELMGLVLNVLSWRYCARHHPVAILFLKLYFFLNLCTFFCVNVCYMGLGTLRGWTRV